MGELNPHLGLIPKVIYLKLFLDMVPSSTVDVNVRCVDVLACFLETIRNAMFGKCGLKVACMHFVDERKYKNILIE